MNVIVNSFVIVDSITHSSPCSTLCLSVCLSVCPHSTETVQVTLLKWTLSFCAQSWRASCYQRAVDFAVTRCSVVDWGAGWQTARRV